MYNWYRFPEDISKAPTFEGVYLLSETASENGIVYVGRADDLNQRLSQHPDPENPCLQKKDISYFAYEVTNNSENREQELIDKYDPVCNHTN
ncbi:GIY-YIG nuclease family protein [Patescibacteria group bacterium]|nr:GIY-YIG nuclease family protein [Patescibacteria group bacterium]MBU4480759.1 GIY-YIG nuclease family protein [Patescibacteria group bacterium]